MAWEKLSNPKPSADGLNPLAVKVVARELKVRGGGTTRYITIKIGSSLAGRAKFLQDEHNCHVMVGSGADAGKLGVSIDDTLGKFKAKRKGDGRYEIVLRQAASAGKFSLTFPPFERAGSVQQPPGCPPVLTFEVTPEFLAFK